MTAKRRGVGLNPKIRYASVDEAAIMFKEPGWKMSNAFRILLIDRLIPAAAKEARQKVRAGRREYELREHKGEPYHHDFWTEYFHEAMDRLTKEQGLRSL